MKTTLVFSAGIVLGAIVSGAAYLYAVNDLPQTQPGKSDFIDRGRTFYAQHQAYTHGGHQVIHHWSAKTGRQAITVIAPHAGNLGGSYSTLDDQGKSHSGNFSTTKPLWRTVPPFTGISVPQQYWD